MSTEPKGLEVLFLWRLAVAGGSDWLKGFKPDPGAPARSGLAKAGFITAEKRSPQGRGPKQLYLSLTDHAWEYLSEHLDAPIATRSPASLEILVRLLARLKAHLDARKLSLGEFIQTASGVPPIKADLPRQIEVAYLKLSGGRENVRVRLADLRDALPDVPRLALDASLIQMATAGRVSLYRLDNPLEIDHRDRDAVLRTPSGEERHIVYLGGRGS
jgi:hypothetical protein